MLRNSLRFLKPLLLTLIGAVGMATMLQAQTTVISGTGAGSFESGSFAGDGWTAVQGTTPTNNILVVGTAAGASHGTQATFPSNNGTSYAYTVTNASFSWIYKDVTLNAGEVIGSFTADLKGNPNDAGYDGIVVGISNQSYLVTANQGATGLMSGTIVTGLDIATTATSNGFIEDGNYAVFTTRAFNFTPAQLGNGTSTSLKRIWIGWRNDGSGGTTPMAVDKVNFTTALPTTYTTTALGGLYNSPATWVGGVVPTAGSNISVPAGATLTLNQAISVSNITVSGKFQTNGSAFAIVATGDMTINAGGEFYPNGAGSTMSMTFSGNFINNGTANLSYSGDVIFLNGANTILGGTGTYIGPGTKGIIDQLLFNNTTTSTVNTSQGIITRNFGHSAGTLTTNGKLEIDNTAIYYGNAYNQQVYTVIVTGMGAGYTSAPTVTIAAPTGTGTQATATANFDAASGTVRSITITNPGSGYRANPAVTFTGGGFTTAAVATAQVFTSSTGSTASQTQKTPAAVITGALPIKSDQAVGSVFATNGGVGYTSAPAVGFSLPTAINLVTAGGSGYTTAPIITVSAPAGGGTTAVATAVVAQGKVVSVYVSTVGTNYTTVPTITITGGGGTGAAAAFPAPALPTAIATISNGMVSNFALTNAGYGYTAAPVVTLTGGGATTAATGATARVGLYNLLYNFYTPATSNPPASAGVEIPSNNRINTISITSSTVTLNANLEVYAASTALTLSTSILNLNNNTLTFSNPGYTGNTSSTATNYVAGGPIVLSSPGGSVTRNFPFPGYFVVNTGTGSLATGSTITRITAQQAAAPSGTANVGTPIGSRTLRATLLPGEVYGTAPTVTLNYTTLDNLVSDQANLFVAQAASPAGPFTVRSVSSGSGALGTSGSKTTATTTPGPFVPTGDDYFAFVNTLQPLNYDVVRNTGIAYQSIMGSSPTFGTVGNTGTSADDNTFSVALTGSTFQYAGSPVSAITVNNNGHISLFTGATTSYLNNLGGFTKVLAPFWDDLVSPGYSTASTVPFLAYKVIGTLGSGSAVIVVEWAHMETFQNAGPDLNFQIRMYEGSNKIEFNYGVMQGFNGTVGTSGAYSYSYSCGLSGGSITSGSPALGEVMAQQAENTRFFSPYSSQVANLGVNKLSVMPECNSQLVFTPGAYTPYTPPASNVPVNDEPATATVLTALPGAPSDLCGTFYTSRFATASGGPAPAACTGIADDDVWFKFNAISPVTSVKVYSSGGYDAAVEVYDASLAAVPSSCTNVVAEGLTETVSLTTLTVGQDYYVRVYHKNGGTQATATATVSGGVITGITVVNPGSGYMNAAYGGALTTASPRVTITGGGGRNAVVSATTAGTNTTPGTITGFTIAAGGVGYTSAPTVTIDPSGAGTTGDFAITVFATPPPPANDNPCGAVALTTTTTCTPFTDNSLVSTTSLINATNTTTNGVTAPSCSGAGAVVNDVWFTFVAPSGTTNITISPVSGVNVAGELYSAAGTCPGSLVLTSLGCTNSATAGGAETITSNTLVGGNTYYVRVYNHPNGPGGSAVSNSQFSICVTAPIPSCTTNVSPANLSTNASLTPTLTWTAAANATVYDVYFGTSIGSAAIIGSPTTNSFTIPAPLNPATQYFFYVVPRNTNGTASGCSSNATSFTTANAVYTYTGTGQWSTAANWSNGIVPNSCSIDVVVAPNSSVTVDGTYQAGIITTNASTSAIIVPGGNTLSACTNMVNNGLVTVSGGALTVGTNGLYNNTLTNASTSTLVVSSGTLNINGNLNIVSGSLFNQSGGDINVDGNNGGATTGSVASGTYLVAINSPNNTNISLTGGTLTIVDPHTSTTGTYSLYASLSTVPGISADKNHTLRFGNGVSADAGGNATMGFGVYNWPTTGFFKPGSVVINGPSANNRMVTSTGTYNVFAVNGSMTVNNGGVFQSLNSATSTTGAVHIGGDLTVNTGGTFTATSSVNFDTTMATTGTTLSVGPSLAAQTVNNAGIIRNDATAPTAMFTNISVINSYGVTFNQNDSLSGSLTAAPGITGASKIIMANNSKMIEIAGAGTADNLSATNGWVVGRFQKALATTVTLPLTFAVGDAATYAPVVLSGAAGAVTTAGSVVASTTPGEILKVVGGQPLINTAKINQDKDVNRYWTLEEVSGITFGANAVTVMPNWAYPSDVDPGAIPANFIVARYDQWVYPTVSNPTTTSIEALNNNNGGASTIFGDYIVGEPAAKPSVVAGLQGSMQGSGSMRNDLQTYFGPGSGLLPTTDPYGLGATYADINNLGGAAGPVADWVRLEVWNPAVVTGTPVESRALLMKTDGTIVDTRGLAPALSVRTGNMRLVVKQRNHMAVMSNDVTLNDAFPYNFTTSLSQASVQPGEPAQMTLVGGKWCMWAGDVNQDLVVEIADRNIVNSRNLAGDYDAYQREDVNLDGVVDIADVNITNSVNLQGIYSTLFNY